MQPVVDFTCLVMNKIYDIIIVVVLATLVIYVWDCIEQSMMMRYYKFREANVISLQPEWVYFVEESIQVAYSKIDKYTPRDWRMYNEGNDSGYNDGYNWQLTEGYDDRWDTAEEYYQKIFKRELREAKGSWQRTFDEVGWLPSEDMDDKFKDELPPDEWKDYKKDSEWWSSIW